MFGTWNLGRLLAVTVFALLLALAFMPAPVQAMTGFELAEPVEDATELIADAQQASDEVMAAANINMAPDPERSTGTPGGVGAKVTNSEKVTDNANAVPPGGAVGTATNGIRGTTHI